MGHSTGSAISISNASGLHSSQHAVVQLCITSRKIPVSLHSAYHGAVNVEYAATVISGRSTQTIVSGAVTNNQWERSGRSWAPKIHSHDE